jgi:hypothetical protein
LLCSFAYFLPPPPPPSFSFSFFFVQLCTTPTP